MSAATAEIIDFPEPTLGDGDDGGYGGPDRLPDFVVRLMMRLFSEDEETSATVRRIVVAVLEEYFRRGKVVDMTTTTTETVALLRAGMTAAASAAAERSPDILGGFCERLCVRLELEDEQTQATVVGIVSPILDAMAEERGTEE